MRAEGYWISPDGDIVEVVDHFTQVQEAPEAFGFKAEEAPKWRREDRERVLRQAISRGWIRVRGHRDHTTFELSELNEPAAFAIKDFLRRDGAWENERVEVHELAKKRQWAEEAGFFLRDEHLARLGNPGRVVANDVSPGLAEAVRNEALMKAHGFRPKGSPMVYPLGKDRALGARVVKKLREMPGEPALVGSLLLGLSSGFGKPEKFTGHAVREQAMKWFRAGGTLVLQLGWFEGTTEDSVRITIENAGTGLADDAFTARFDEMARDFGKSVV